MRSPPSSGTVQRSSVVRVNLEKQWDIELLNSVGGLPWDPSVTKTLTEDEEEKDHTHNSMVWSGDGAETLLRQTWPQQERGT